jgi:hypothetical protein
LDKTLLYRQIKKTLNDAPNNAKLNIQKQNFKNKFINNKLKKITMGIVKIEDLNYAALPTSADDLLLISQNGIACKINVKPQWTYVSKSALTPDGQMLAGSSYSDDGSSGVYIRYLRDITGKIRIELRLPYFMAWASVRMFTMPAQFRPQHPETVIGQGLTYCSIKPDGAVFINVEEYVVNNYNLEYYAGNRRSFLLINGEEIIVNHSDL